MIPALQSGLSGARAFEAKVDAAAQNVANADTPGYKKERVLLRETSTGGVSAQRERVTASGPRVQGLDAAGGDPVELSNVDLPDEMTGMLLGERGFELNLKTVQTADEMLGALLDLKG
jgi:flagellar basal-body rod protein FlgC